MSFLEGVKEIFNDGDYEWGNLDGLHFYSQLADDLGRHWMPIGLSFEDREIILALANELSIEIQNQIDNMGYKPYIIKLDYFNVIPILKTKWVYEFYPMVTLTLEY